MRAQAHTLEAIVASLLLLTSVVFALQMTAVTPLSASTSSQHIENQQQASAEGVLASAAETGALRRAILSWNASNNEFYNASTERYYTRGGPPNQFGEILEESFGAEGIAYNVILKYRTSSGGEREQRLVYKGAPSDNAVRAARTVVITDGTHLYDYEGNRHPDIINGSTMNGYLQSDAAPDTAVYNVVRVEVVVWRI